jgi:hypothetical protein
MGLPAMPEILNQKGFCANVLREHIRLENYWNGQKFIGEFIKAFAEM